MVESSDSNSSLRLTGPALALVGTAQAGATSGLIPRARVVSMATSGADSTTMLRGPVPSSRNISARMASPQELAPFVLEIDDLVRGSQQCSVASPQLCVLVEVAAGEPIGVGGS